MKYARPPPLDFFKNYKSCKIINFENFNFCKNLKLEKSEKIKIQLEEHL